MDFETLDVTKSQDLLSLDTLVKIGITGLVFGGIWAVANYVKSSVEGIGEKAGAAMDVSALPEF